MYTISFEPSAFMLSLFCLVYCMTAKRKQYIPPKGFKNKLLDQHFVFLLLLLSTLTSSAASIIGVQLTTLENGDATALKHLFHMFYFMFHSTLAVCFALYIMNVNGTSAGKKRSFFYLFFAPYIVSELMVMTNCVTKWVFYLDAYGYHRGPLIYVLYAIGAFYVILGSVYFFRYKQAIPQADSVTTGLVILLASLGIVVQAIWSDLLVELFFEALAFLVLMVVLEERGGHIDTVTGALNRLAFANANRRMMETGQNYDIVLVKLANFDRLMRLFSGREIDHLLLQVSQFLTSVSTSNNVYCYRYLDFAVIVPKNGKMTAEKLTSAISERFEKEWETKSTSVHIEFLATIINVPKDVSTLEKLENFISIGYRKTKPGSYIVPFSELSMIQHNLDIERALREAIDNHDLEMYYQPICTSVGYKAVTAEALLRVKKGELQDVSPQVYIPVAEQTGLIRDIGLFVFEDVCRFISQNKDKLQGIKYIEINVSIYQLFEDLSVLFEEIRRKYGVDIGMINLEITESASTNDAPEIVSALRNLKKAGYTFSIDDFGTGYSNIVRLLKGSYTNVKIDKSLLWDSDRSASSAKLLEDLTGVLRGLGYNIVQEGVETVEQLKRVTEAGCNLIQGYYFSKPLPEEQFLAYIEKNK